MQKNIYAFILCTLCFLHTFTPCLFAQQSRNIPDRISYSRANGSIAELLENIQQQTAYKFTYDKQKLSAYTLNNIDWKQRPLGDVLQFLEKEKGLEFAVLGNDIAVKSGAVAENKAQPMPGHISGKVTDPQNNALPGVTLRIENSARGTTAGVDGSFRLALPVGRYTILVSMLSFQTLRITDVEVKAGQLTPLPVVLKPGGNRALKEVIVTATYKQSSIEGLYTRQKNNAAVTDGISAEQIQATPDNNAAQVLKRISGLTVQDGKYVTVRGLSERYNTTLLNGSVLPSTEPNKKNFSFDLIPAQLIDNIVVGKTATPDKPGDFSGGIVEVNTKDVPDKSFINIGIGTGINTNSTGRKAQTLHRSNRNYLGYPGENRLWYKQWNREAYQAAHPDNRELTNWKQVTALSRQIPNNWALYENNYQPMQNYQLNAGKVWMLQNDSRIGLIATATYRNEQLTTDIGRMMPGQYDLEGTQYQFITSWGGLAKLAWQTDKHKISWSTLVNRRLEVTSEIRKGLNGTVGPTWEMYDEPLTNMLVQHKLSGQHKIGRHDVLFSWSADMIEANRDLPDVRFLNNAKYQLIDNKYEKIKPHLENISLQEGPALYSDLLDEKRNNLTADISIPFTTGELRQKIKAGYWYTYRQADYSTIGLRVLYDGQDGDDGYNEHLANRPLAEMLQLSNFGQHGLYYRFAGPTLAGDRDNDYHGKQHIHAAYVMGDFQLLPRLRLVGGLRMEAARMKIHTLSFFDGVSYDTTLNFSKTDFLPSVNIIYSFHDKMNIRGAYYKTISRADFRERTGAMVYDYKYVTELVYPLGLKDSYIHNADLRYEFYPSPGEVISVSGFYKYFKWPVEMVQVPTSGGATLRNFYFNLDNSENIGVELDVRKSMGFIAPKAPWLSRLFLSGNISLMKSNVTYNTTRLRNHALLDYDEDESVNDTVQNRTRPLQGLSPYIINVGLLYETKTWGINITYNRIGHRIFRGGDSEESELYEAARDQLDAQLSVRILKQKLELRLNASNILNQPYNIYVNYPFIKNPGALPDPDTDYIETITDANGIIRVPNKSRKYNKGDGIVRKELRGVNLSLSAVYNF